MTDPGIRFRHRRFRHWHPTPLLQLFSYFLSWGLDGQYHEGLNTPVFQQLPYPDKYWMVNSVARAPDIIGESASLVGAIHQPAFGTAMDRLLGWAARFDASIAFAYNGDSAPIDLYHSAHDFPSMLTLDEYQSGAYLLDPFYQCLRRGIAPGVYRLKDLAPDHFFRSEYYRTYYRKTQIVDEVGIFIPMKNGGMIVVSITRETDSKPFGKKEIERVKIIEPIVREAVIQHWQNPEIAEIVALPTGDRFDTLPLRVQNAALSGSRSGLTNRESEVVSLILRGYSSPSIASLLDISVGTVKVHRKNIYAKLTISSQAELFFMFLPLLTRPVT